MKTAMFIATYITLAILYSGCGKSEAPGSTGWVSNVCGWKWTSMKNCTLSEWQEQAAMKRVSYCGITFITGFRQVFHDNGALGGLTVVPEGYYSNNGCCYLISNDTGIAGTACS